MEQDEEDKEATKEEPKEEIEQLEHENEVRADHLGGNLLLSLFLGVFTNFFLSRRSRYLRGLGLECQEISRCRDNMDLKSSRHSHKPSHIIILGVDGIILGQDCVAKTTLNASILCSSCTIL